MKAVGFLALTVSFLNVTAQKIKATMGDPSVLKNETNINIEFTYENVSVGKFADENDYIKKKRDDYNAKTPGRGNKWANDWIADRNNRYEPKFIELFTINSKKTVSKKAKYTLIFKTKSIEPGFSVAGGWVATKNASIDAEVWIVETAKRSNKIAVITVNNAPGGSWTEDESVAGVRISESFAISGKKLAKFIY
ncbi:MAG: hypothetical protein IPL54_15470 [Chitinophagaceae bacterium]|nr:hypothetical protein [Chitinophagaceae bacterium]